MNAKGLCSIKQKAGNVTVQGEVFYRSDVGSSKGKNLIVDRYIAEEIRELQFYKIIDRGGENQHFPATEGILFHIMALLSVCLVLIKFKHLKFTFNIFNKQ